MHRNTQYLDRKSTRNTLCPLQWPLLPTPTLVIFQCNISQKGLATYVALYYLSTTFPSIHRGKLLSLLCKGSIVGRMWKHLRERFHIGKVRVFHPRIPKSSSVDILRGVPERSRLSPTLVGMFVADLIHELKVQFPNATITMGVSGGQGDFSTLTVTICV